MKTLIPKKKKSAYKLTQIDNSITALFQHTCMMSAYYIIFPAVQLNMM